MEKNKLIVVVLLSLMSGLSACNVIGGIFKTGVGVGVFIAVVIIIAIVIISQMVKRR
jgi:hypothetical protein